MNDLDNAKREINHIKEQISFKDKEIEELKDNISRMHEDHSKSLSKVMLDSRVKRRSGMNISSYSSSSLKDI
jgi:predicted  nucleic acid-binding Zn-ribbon protein